MVVVLDSQQRDGACVDHVGARALFWLSASRAAGFMRGLLFAATVCVIGACSSEKTPEPDPTGVGLPRETPIQVIQQEGEYARVQTEDGQTGYVDARLLKWPVGPWEMSDTTHRVLSADTTIYDVLSQKSPSEIPPRSSSEVRNELLLLNSVFLSSKSGAKIIMPVNAARFQDNATGEWYLPAYTCHNPDCPAKTDHPDGPFLFTEVQAIKTGSSKRPSCPSCLSLREPGNESVEEARRYFGFVKPYRLPHTARRIEELEDENKKRQKQRRRTRMRKQVVD